MEKTIVVAEDSRTMREAIRRVLEPEGFHLFFASDGADGLRLVRQATPHLVLADLNLVDGDAAWLIGQMAAEPALAAVPVVIMHGPKETVAEKDRMRLGAAGALSKPFAAAELLETVMRSVHQPKPAAAKPRLSTLEDRIARMEQVLGGSPTAAAAKPAASDQAAVLDALRQAGRTFKRAAGRAAEPRQPTAKEQEVSRRTEAYVPRGGPVRVQQAEPATAPALAPVPAPAPEPVVAQPPTPAPPAATAAPVVAAAPEPGPRPAAAGPLLGREELLEAVRQVAREAVERAIWEMVPDLAEKVLWEVVPGVVESLAREHVLGEDGDKS